MKLRCTLYFPKIKRTHLTSHVTLEREQFNHGSRQSQPPEKGWVHRDVRRAIVLPPLPLG